MALIHGKDGTITITDGSNGDYGTELAAAMICISSFSIDVAVDSLEASCMATTAKQYLAGTKGWTASIECNAQDSGYAIAGIGDTPNFVFKPDGTTSVVYTGDGIITGISGSVDVNGVGTVSYTVQGTGALTETTS